MKKDLLFLALAFIALTVQSQNKIEEYDQFTDENGIVYSYEVDNWYASYEDSDELSWVVKNGLAVTGHAVLLNEIQGEKVRVIGAGAFRNWDDMAGVNPNLTGITIPDNEEIIQMAAFLGCKNLKTIDLNNVRRIDYATFVNCTGLEEIHIRVPASNMKFGWTVFNIMDEEGSFGTDVIPATVYVPKGELQNYIAKFANPYENPEDPMAWEESVLYEIYKAGRLKEEGDAPSNPIPGDANGSGIVDVEDVNAAINLALSSGFEAVADMNDDGIIDVEDINGIINIILNK